MAAVGDVRLFLREKAALPPAETRGTIFFVVDVARHPDFTRDDPGTGDPAAVEAFADAILALPWRRERQIAREQRKAAEAA